MNSPMDAIDPSSYSHLSLLLQHIPTDRAEELRHYVYDLVAKDEEFGIDLSFLGFLDDYLHFAALAKRKLDALTLFQPRFPVCTEFTVWDVGCATGLQHVFFDPRIRYVGIDTNAAPMFFRSNCFYRQGLFSEALPRLTIGPNDIGIANMSLLYGSSERERLAFDQAFRRKFIL